MRARRSGHDPAPAAASTATSSQANPKPLLGYSDITLLHLEMERLGLTSLHGPMVARELADGDTAYDLPSLWHALTGEGEPYASGPDDLVVLAGGQGEGRPARRLPLAPGGGGRHGLGAAQRRTSPRSCSSRTWTRSPTGSIGCCGSCGPRARSQGVTGVVFGDMKGCAPGFHEDYRLEEILLEALEGSRCRWPSASRAATRPTRT